MDTPRTDHDDAAIAAANDAVSDAYASPGTPARVLQAVDQARDAKYQARYGDDPVTRWVSLAAPAQPTGAPPSAEAAEGPDPAIASMGAATLRARISAIRGLLKEVTDIEDERVLLTDMHACYARLYPEPTAGEEAPPAPARDPAGRFSASSGEPLALPDIPPELGRAYDGGVLAELAPAVASAGIPLDELRGWVEKGHWQMVKGIRPTVDERDAKLREWFGHQARACVDDARSVLSRLPPQTREAVSGWIDRTGLRYSAPFTAWLASHGARLKTRPGG